MPYKSLKQERYFNANRAQLERKGVNVDEWNRASKGKKLPMKKMTKKQDDAYDKKHKIKEGSKKDKALDKKRGIKEKMKSAKKAIKIGIEMRPMEMGEMPRVMPKRKMGRNPSAYR